MTLRIVVVIFTTVLLALLPETGFKQSHASSSEMAPDSLWAKWEHVSLRIMKEGRLRDYFENLHHQKRFNGAVLVSEKGNLLYEGGFGMADEKLNQAITPDTHFQLASVSKMFTATAIMLLFQEGKLDFDDTVAAHLPGWPYEDMTIRHLLNHRSGLARYEAVASWYWKNYREPLSNTDLLNLYIRHKPVIFFTPGNGFNYCNTNYVILACIVEKISGVSFQEFMETHVFQPLCMDAVVYSRVTEPEVPDKAVGYKPGRKGYYPAQGDYLDGVVGDKGLYASVHDLDKYDHALSEYTLLYPSTLEEAFSPGSGGRVHNYGFGWRMKINGDKKILYHFGWWRGFRTCYIRDPERNLSIMVLSNRDEPGFYVDYWEVYETVAAL
ncbi:MAG: serine hydrolase domain-containing protein [Bacteroidia bacterium]